MPRIMRSATAETTQTQPRGTNYTKVQKLFGEIDALTTQMNTLKGKGELDAASQIQGQITLKRNAITRLQDKAKKHH